MSGTTFYTTGLMSRISGQPLHRFEYLIKARGITAIGMAGNAKVYSKESFDEIVAEIRRIDEARAAEARAIRPRRATPAAPELVGTSGAIS